MREKIAECNKKSGLNMQLVVEDQKAYSGIVAKYGNFRNVPAYIAMVGPVEKSLDETCGYYGEMIVLYAQQLGLHTCWCGIPYTRNKSAYTVGSGEKFVLMIAIGYGDERGTVHKSQELLCFLAFFLNFDIADSLLLTYNLHIIYSVLRR